MANFFRDILMYPLIIIQMILVGPHLWGSSESSNIPAEYKGQATPYNSANSSGAQNGNTERFHNNPEEFRDVYLNKNIGPVEDAAVNWDKKAKKTWNYLKLQSRRYIWDKHVGNNSVGGHFKIGADGVATVFKGAYESSQNTSSGQKAKKAAAATARAAKKVFNNTWGIGGKTAEAYYKEQGKNFHETANKHMDWGGIKEKDYWKNGPKRISGPQHGPDYILKEGKFYSEASGKYMHFEMGNPAARFIAHEQTKKMVEAHFAQSVNGWVKSGGHKHITGTRQLRETLSNMYRNANQTVIMSELGITLETYNKEFRHIIKGGLKAAEKDMRRLSGNFFKEIMKVRSGTLPEGEFIKSVLRSNVAEGGYALKEKKVRALNTNVLGVGVVTRSIKLWPIETLYFNMAIAASSYIMANNFDDTFNPLYAQENEDMRHNGFKTKDYIGVEIPMLEALDLGFLGFIVGNQAFQKIAPYTKLPMSMRGYMGMGVGSVVSSIIHSVKDSQAWQAQKAASEKFAEIKAEAMLLPIGQERDQLMSEAYLWQSVAKNANSIVFNDVINSNFWKQQLDHIFTLIGASIAAAGVTKLFTSSVRLGAAGINRAGRLAGKKHNIVSDDPIENAKRRKMALKSYDSAKARVVKTVKPPKGIGMARVRGAASMVAFRAADFGRGVVAVLFAHPVMRLVHFSLFLMADPIVRALSAPVMKAYRAEDAREKLEYIRKELPKERNLLTRGVYFDRLTMDVYEGKEGTLSRWFNSGDYQKSASTFWNFKDYFDSKMAYRAKQTERLAHKHSNWKIYLEKFLKASEVTSHMYTSLFDDLGVARTQAQNGTFRKGFIDPELINMFNYSQYSVLHAKTREELVYTTLMDAAYDTDYKDYGFDEANLAKWQAELFRVDLDNISSGAKDKWLWTGRPRPELGFKEYSKTKSEVKIRVFFRNEIAESILWGMVFGPDAKEEKVFQVREGRLPVMEYPRIIEKLPYSKPSIKHIKFDEKDLVKIGEVPATLTRDGVATVFHIPLMRLKLLDTNDGKYKNILQLITDRLLPELRLSTAGAGGLFGSSEDETDMNIETYLKKHVLCMPEGEMNNDALALTNRENMQACSENSVYAALKYYDAVFADFVEHDVARIIGRLSHQQNSKTNFTWNMIKKYGPAVLTQGMVHKLVAEKSINDVRKQYPQESINLISSNDFENFEPGNENVFLSIMEDIVAAGGFLQTALPSKSDYNKETQLSLYQRAQMLEKQKREYGIAANTSKLATNFLDMVLANKDSAFHANKKYYEDTVNQLEIDFNKAMCYLNNRPTQIDPKNPKTSGVVEINNTRYYRNYDNGMNTYNFTRIGPRAFCDRDQIVSKIDINSVIESEVRNLELDENAFDMGHWAQMFTSDDPQSREQLHPSEASPEKLAQFYNLDPQRDIPTIVSKVMETVFIQQDEVISAEDRNDSRRIRELLRQNLELATSISIEEEKEREAIMDNLGVGAKQDSQEVSMLASAMQVDRGRVFVDKNRMLQPFMTVRTAIASKSIGMMRQLMNMEAPQFHPYLMSMKQYAPNSYDELAIALCEVRNNSSNTFASLSGNPAIATPENSSCRDFEGMFINGQPTSEFQDRQQRNQEKTDKYDEHYQPKNEWIRWWERLSN